MSKTLVAPAAGGNPRKVTREEYQALPEGPPYYELIYGKLVEMPRPLEDHSELHTLLIELLGPHVRRSLGGILTLEPNLYLPGTEDVYHPDLVYLSAEHRAIRRRGGIYGVPDWICEILSPSTERRDRDYKLHEYARAGVSHLWLLEPERPVAVEEYVLDEGGYRLNKVVEAPSEWEPAAFPGWRLSLAELDAAVAPLGDEE